MTVGATLLALLAATGLVAMPAWSHSRDWGWGLASAAFALFAAVIALMAAHAT